MLNLSGCDQITDAGLKALAAGCHATNVLNLSGCDQITDEGVESLADGCPNINVLNLSGCDQITVDGIRRRFYDIDILFSLSKS